MKAKFIPIDSLRSGDWIRFYSPRKLSRLGFRSFGTELKLLSKVTNREGKIPVSGIGPRFPGSSTVPHEEGVEYRTISERDLIQAMLVKQAIVVENKLILPDEEYSFNNLWKWYCDGEWDNVRSLKTDSPAMWVQHCGNNNEGSIRDMSYTNPSTNWINYPGAIQSDDLTRVDICDDDQLVPHATSPNLLKAVAMFNSIIRHEKNKK